MDLPTSAQLASLSPVAAFLTSKTSRSRSLLSRFQGRPRRCRTMPAEIPPLPLAEVLVHTVTRVEPEDLPTSHTTAQGLRDRVPEVLREDTFSPLVVMAPTAHCAAHRAQYPKDHTQDDQDHAEHPRMPMLNTAPRTSKTIPRMINVHFREGEYSASLYPSRASH